jgi:chemotaxis signal transduction protein
MSGANTLSRQSRKNDQPQRARPQVGLGSESDTYIVFELENTQYALPSHVVQQMEMVEEITLVPNAPEAVEGVVFARGQVIPALSLRVRFGLPKRPHTLRSRLIVVNSQDRTLGMIVDTAREFIKIPAEAIQPPPDALNNEEEDYLLGIASIGERFILILNSDRIISSTGPIQISVPSDDQTDQATATL